jgi:hypothetical protein
VNFNHLMESRHIKRKCKSGKVQCYWAPVGNIRSTHGNNVHMTMYCKHCNSRQDIFLTQETYRVQEKLILREVNNA